LNGARKRRYQKSLEKKKTETMDIYDIGQREEMHKDDEITAVGNAFTVGEK